MIRVFELFRKLNFINISAKDLFLQSMVEFKPHEYKCPFCTTEHPDWKKHAVYDRYLISFENGCVISYRINIVRFKCSSCGHTHAVLPESIIPYQSYSFLFIIAVMRDYFTRSLTVEGICAKYEISVSTVYLWKKLFLRHKKIWLGLLNDACTSSIQFLNSFSTGGLLPSFEGFFFISGVSFLQGPSRMGKSRSSPA
jgi:transposase-like protein